MDKIFPNGAKTLDSRLFIASIVGVYSPLILILTAALVLF
jgi:hypothetical protein